MKATFASTKAGTSATPIESPHASSPLPSDHTCVQGADPPARKPLARSDRQPPGDQALQLPHAPLSRHHHHTI